MSESNNSLKGILITQSVLLVIALIGIYGNWINIKETNRNELEKELILNAYTLTDSLQQVNRLKTFCDLDFFGDDRKKILLEKISQGRFVGGGVKTSHLEGIPTGEDCIEQSSGTEIEYRLRDLKVVFVCTSVKARLSERANYRTYHKVADCSVLKKCDGEIIMSEATKYTRSHNWSPYSMSPCGVCFKEIFKNDSLQVSR